MSTILFTKDLLEDAVYTGGRGAWQIGLIATGSSDTAVTYTIASGIVLNRPFLKSAAFHSSYAPWPAKFMAGGPANVTKLIVYTGERPDISTITDLAAFESDRLIQFSIPAYSSNRANTGLFVETGSNTDYQGFKAICGICPTLTSALNSGIATWFWFGPAMTTAEAQVFNASYTGNYNNLSGTPFVTGSVGLLGSGSDLEIADKNIVSGQQYKSFGFNFYVPAVNTIVE